MAKITINSTRPIVQMALNRAFSSIPDFKPGDKIQYHGQKYIVKQGNYNRGPLIFIDPSKPNDELTASPFDVKLVNSSVACNTFSEVEISLSWASRLQDTMRDLQRHMHGVRISSSNTLTCPNEDSAEEVVEYLTRYAKVPKSEVWINSASADESALASLSPVARNAVRNAAASVVRNGIGDCFSDAAAWCNVAASTGKVRYLQDALRDVLDVTSYSWANAKDKAGKAKCVALIKAAISKPTPENIKKAEAACTVERKRADGESFASVRNSIACNGNGWTMADAKQWAQELAIIADKGYNDDWLEEGLDSWKMYGRQFANLVGPAEAKKVETAIKSGRAKDIPRIVGGMKPYQPKGHLNSIACNWQRSEDLSKVQHAIDLLTGLYNNYVQGRYEDVDAAEEGAFKSMKDAIGSLRKIADVFRRNRS